MTKLMVKDALFPECPIRNILSRIGDKWSVLLLFTLQQQDTRRFSALQKEIPDISQKMLASTLRTLEEDGFVVRRVYAQVPPKVEYSLTPRARSLLPHLQALIGWAQENQTEIVQDRNRKRGEVTALHKA